MRARTRVVSSSVHPVVTPRRTGSLSVHIVVRLEASSGLIGWGEISDLDCYRMTAPDVTAIDEAVRRMTVGFDPSLIAALHLRMSALLPDYRYCARTYPPFSLGSQLAAGIEMACYDLMGKDLDVPISDLLGGKVRDSFEVAYPIFTVSDDAGTAAAHLLVDECLASGMSTFRYYVGDDLDASRRFLEGVTNSYGNRISIKALDFQGRRHWKDVLRFYSSLSHLESTMPVALLESPSWREDYEGMAELRRRVEPDIGEHASSSSQMLRMLRAGAVDVFNISIQSGGMYTAKRLFNLADGGGARCLLGTTQEMSLGTAAGAHLAAVIDELAHPSDPAGPLLYTADVAVSPVQYTDGRLNVPSGPGLGIDVDEAQLVALAGDLAPWDKPAHGDGYVSH